MTAEVWVLGDHRVGNTNQAIALAEELGLSYEVKNIKYNFLSKLPNLFLQFNPLHIKNEVLKTFEQVPFPKIIISSGRRTASLALYLKEKSGSNLKVVQIMRPDIDSKNFNLIILPQHDNVQQVNSHIVRIIGALSNSATKIERGAEELSKNYPEAKNFIAVLIGGNTKKHKFTEANANAIAQALSNIAINHSCPLFFSFTRRTPEATKSIIKNMFPWPHIIYDPSDNRPNPYYGMLGRAEFIICTGDSVSMCSEVASTGKPFYIYCPNGFKIVEKHRFFIQQLVDIGVARKFEDGTVALEHYYYPPLNEVRKIADIVRSELLDKV